MVLSSTGSGIVRLRKVSGTLTRAAATVSGAQAVTGLGGKPIIVFFHGLDDNSAATASNGFDDGSISCSIRFNTTSNTGSQTQSIHVEIPATVNGHSANISSMDSDGFTLNWTKIGDGRAITIKYVAILEN